MKSINYAIAHISEGEYHVIVNDNANNCISCIASFNLIVTNLTKDYLCLFTIFVCMYAYIHFKTKQQYSRSKLMSVKAVT